MNLVDGGHSDRGCLFERISVNAGADGWESHASEIVLPGDLERPSIAGRQKFGFASVTAVPHRPHRVNNTPRRQAVALGEFCVSGLATAQVCDIPPTSRVRRRGGWRRQRPRPRADEEFAALTIASTCSVVMSA